MRDACVILIVIAASLPAHAQSADADASRFDGEWTVTINCPSNTENSAARGYKRQFAARVNRGVLSGETGVADSPGWLRIDGRVGADGAALFDAHGRTGDPDYAVNHPPPSSPYAYHIDARFDAAHGTGRRLEQRVCSFAFDRR